MLFLRLLLLWLFLLSNLYSGSLDEVAFALKEVWSYGLSGPAFLLHKHGPG